MSATSSTPQSAGVSPPGLRDLLPLQPIDERAEDATPLVGGLREGSEVTQAVAGVLERVVEVEGLAEVPRGGLDLTVAHRDDRELEVQAGAAEVVELVDEEEVQLRNAVGFGVHALR